MKKYYYGMLALTFALSIPAISLAQYGNPSANNSGAPTPPPPPPTSIPAAIRSEYQSRLQNVEDNQNYRNTVLEGRYGSTTPPWMGSSTPQWDGTSTPPREGEMMPPRYGSTTPPWVGSSTMPRDGRPMMWNASTTPFASSSMMYAREGYVEGGRGMIFEMFRMRKHDITAQLQTALGNLTEIRGRIDARIQTEQQGGTDMSAAISLLATADADIASATSAVNALAAYMPTASSTVSASTTIDLGDARGLARTAQTAIEQAQKALGDVVRAIAQAMGVELGENSVTTTSSTTTQ